MRDVEAVEKLRQCRLLCQRLAGLDKGGVELTEADHLAFAGFREVYYSVMRTDFEEGKTSKQKELDNEERMEGLALAVGLTRPELIMLISLLALHAPLSSSIDTFSASWPKRRRRSRFKAAE